jgi:hypothetical protein
VTNPPGESASPEALQLPVGFDERFQCYIGIFIAAGKPLSRMDITLAHAVWTGLSFPDREKALADALHTCQRQKNPRYIPFPKNHLLSASWERDALPRTLEFIDPKAEESRNKVQSAYERIMAWRKSA